MAASTTATRPERPAPRIAKGKPEARAERDIAKTSGRLWAGGWAE